MRCLGIDATRLLRGSRLVRSVESLQLDFGSDPELFSVDWAKATSLSFNFAWMMLCHACCYGCSLGWTSASTFMTVLWVTRDKPPHRQLIHYNSFRGFGGKAPGRRRLARIKKPRSGFWEQRPRLKQQSNRARQHSCLRSNHRRRSLSDTSAVYPLPLRPRPGVSKIRDV